MSIAYCIAEATDSVSCSNYCSYCLHSSSCVWDSIRWSYSLSNIVTFALELFKCSFSYFLNLSLFFEILSMTHIYAILNASIYSFLICKLGPTYKVKLFLSPASPKSLHLSIISGYKGKAFVSSLIKHKYGYSICNISLLNLYKNMAKGFPPCFAIIFSMNYRNISLSKSLGSPMMNRYFMLIYCRTFNS